MAVVVDESSDGRGVIQIEVEDAPAADHADLYDGRETRGAGDRVVRVSRPLFQEAVALVRNCADEVAAQLETMPAASRPHEVELQMGVKVDGKVGAKIVELTSGCQLQVTLRWQPARP
ncbi:CU044_2847 family protein [Actinomadura terrae]|uniref:CU044_2847 family protein n=1 Tax=Actinomadura terrae TaxID=604353 RepID=UPI001FA762EE|nr:CU044_2847 family protein [Actinomadura terrae]